MKNKGLLCALVLGTVMTLCTAAWAEEQEAETNGAQPGIYQTEDGVLSIDASDDQWVVMSDPNHWFTLSDGGNTITIDHLANGEALPAPAVAGGEAAAVYQAFVSTKNEVFVIKGSALKQEDLADIMRMIGTVKVLKYDTKTAISQEKAAESTGFTVTPINQTYYCTSDYLNVRLGCSTNDTAIGFLTYGEEVTVIGSVSQDGQDTGWYQVSYNGTNAYASAAFLSGTKPEEKADAQASDTSSDDYFFVYGSDRISLVIHPVGGSTYEDLEGRTYINTEPGVYYRVSTDEYFADSLDVWDYGALKGQGMDYSGVNVEGDPYGDLVTGGEYTGEINVEGDPYGDLVTGSSPSGN